MSETKTRKELKTEYKNRTIVGGVFTIKNQLNNKLLLCATTDLMGSKNRFEFAQMTGNCVDMKLKQDWDVQKGKQYLLEVLEEINKKETQTDKEFKADLELLKEMWQEKLSEYSFY